MRKLAAAVLSLSAFSACGGGGGGASVGQAVSIEATPIRVFFDQSGVARIVAQSGEERTTGYVIAPDVGAFSREIENTGNVEPVDLSSLSIIEQGPTTTIRVGAFTQSGESVDVVSAVTNAEDAALILLEEPVFGYSTLIATGTQVTGIPTGRVNYSGVLGLQRASGAAERGTFTATADFSGNPNISLNGMTDSYSVSGNGPINGGSFASATMTIVDGSSSVGAFMNGDFHGDGANSIAGVISSNDNAGTYRGGFVGSQ